MNILKQQNPRDVPVYINVKEKNQKTNIMKKTIENKFALDGFEVVQDKNKAGVIIDVVGVLNKRNPFSRFHLKLKAKWNFSQLHFFAVEGNDGDGESIKNHRISNYDYSYLISNVYDELMKFIDKVKSVEQQPISLNNC